MNFYGAKNYFTDEKKYKYDRYDDDFFQASKMGRFEWKPLAGGKEPTNTLQNLCFHRVSPNFVSKTGH